MKLFAEQLGAAQPDILGQTVDLVLTQEAEVIALTLFGVGLGMLMQWLMLTHPTPQLEQAGERGLVAPSRARVLKAFLATLLSLAFIAFLDLQPGRVGDALQSASDVVASHSAILLVAGDKSGNWGSWKTVVVTL